MFTLTASHLEGNAKHDRRYRKEVFAYIQAQIAACEPEAYK